jgi:molybdopterin molybdotransferase
VIPLDEARAAVLAGCAPLPTVRWPLSVADGCVVAADVRADEAVPAFDNSAMDGFAVRAADLAADDDDTDRTVTLAIVGRVLAGHPVDIELGAGDCVRVMTGAPLPAGADTVVPVERVAGGTWPPDDAATVTMPAGGVATGDHVRQAGDDVQPGDVVVETGAVLTPARLGAIASVGHATVTVHARPLVGVFTTGDELVGPGWPLAAGQIRDSNRVGLLAQLARDGFTPVDLGRIPDDEAALTSAITSAVKRCDALLTTGGVSMGQVDLVRVVLDRVGDMRWMQVAIKPAKPFAFGLVTRPGVGDAADRQVPVFGLPGNPVSALVSYLLLARPGLRRLAGHRPGDLVRPTVPAIADTALARRPDGKLHAVRVLATVGADGRWRVRPSGAQGSHQLGGLAAANALALVPNGDGVPEGGTVDVLMLD